MAGIYFRGVPVQVQTAVVPFQDGVNTKLSAFVPTAEVAFILIAPDVATAPAEISAVAVIAWLIALSGSAPIEQPLFN